METEPLPAGRGFFVEISEIAHPGFKKSFLMNFYFGGLFYQFSTNNCKKRV